MKRLALLALCLLALAGCDNKHDHEQDNAPAPTHSEPLPVEVVPAPAPIDGTITRRSVHIGINRYPGASLSGCVPDARTDAAICKAHGFDDQRLILDEASVKANIIAGMKWAVDVKPPAIVCITYSGHGAQWAGPGSNDEPDRLSEILCPIDLAWTPETVITDDEILAILDKVPDGVAVWLLLDSCHSDLFRGVSQNQKPHESRSYPNVPAEVKARVKRSKQNTTQAKLAGLKNVAFGAACKSNQLSIDTTDENGVPCGGFTDEFKKALAHNAQAKFSALINACVEPLAPYDQTPQAEGGLINQPFLTPCGWRKTKAKQPAEIIPIEKPANLKTSYYEIPAWPPATIKIVG